MPIDTMMLDPMLGTFRNMLEECKQKGMTGDDFDKNFSLFAQCHFFSFHVTNALSLPKARFGRGSLPPISPERTRKPGG